MESLKSKIDVTELKASNLPIKYEIKIEIHAMVLENEMTPVLETILKQIESLKPIRQPF